MKKSAKLFAALAALALTAVAALSAKPAVARADENGSVSASERSSFGSVRVTQVKGNDVTPSSEDLSLDVPSFATRGYSSGIVRFDMGVKESDWTGATAMRLTFTSVYDPNYNLPVDKGNNIAIGFGAQSTSGSGNVLLKTCRPREGSVKFQWPYGKNHGLLYLVSGTDEYFNVARVYNGCVELALNADTFGFPVVAGNGANKIFNRENEPADADTDMSRVNHVFVQFQPVSFDGLVMNFGKVEIKVNNKWTTVVDLARALIVEKPAETTYYSAITSLTENQVMLDPVFNESMGVDTSSFTLEKLDADRCFEHVDNNGDSFCDFCFAVLTHYGWDNDLDGVCDDCDLVICDEGEHKDANLDGICDVCDHLTEDPGNKAEVEPEHFINPINVLLYVVGGVLAAGGVALIVIALIKKKKEKTE